MRPLFEVVTPAATNARALTTAANVRAIIGSPAGDDAIISTLIDRATASMVNYCGLARDVTGKVPTFGAETLRATWFAAHHYVTPHYLGAHHYAGRDPNLILPWRVPVSGIVSVVEDDVTLTEGTDFVQAAAGMLRRICDDAARQWSLQKIVVTYEAGWNLPADVPAEIEAAAIEQVKYLYLSRRRDPSLRSETVPDVYQASFSVAGGDSIGESGLLVSVEGKLSPYRDWSNG